jgi:hypothetical protein
MQVDVKHDLRRLSIELGLYPKERLAAAVSAVNKTLTTVRAEAARRIAASYKIKTNEAKKSLRIEKSSRNEVRGAVVASGQPIPLFAFSARQTKKGVTVNVTGKRKLMRHAFIATMKSGHKGVFIRSRGGGHPVQFRHGKGSRLRKKGRDLPITELISISVPAAFALAKVGQALIAVAQKRFAEAFAQEARFRLSKRGG